MSDKPPSGWYPGSNGETRWWDGEQWTEHRRPAATSETPTGSRDDVAETANMASVGNNPQKIPAKTSHSAAPDKVLGGRFRRFIRSRLVIGLGAGLLGLIAGTVLGAYGAVDVPDAEPGSSGTEVIDEPTEEEPSEEPAAQLTDEGDSGGLSLKLVSVKRKDSISYKPGTISDLTPKGNGKTVRATDGGYFLYVKTNGRNGTKAPIDLTCGYPIDVVVEDMNEAQYSPIDGLDQIPGNPGCNEMTQPGQKFKEKFIFLMPEGSEPSHLVWKSVDDDLNEAEPAAISLQ